MAKITRISQDDRPSSLTSPVKPDLELANVAGMVGKVVNVGAELAANAYARNQKALAEARAKKKEIVDAVSAGALAAQYEEATRDVITKTQEEFYDAPDKAPEALIPRLQELEKSYRGSVDDVNVQLLVAKSFASQNQSSEREIGNWAEARLTEQTKEKIIGMKDKLVISAGLKKSIVEVQALAVRVDADTAIDQALGKKAKEEKRAIKEAMFNAFGESQAKVEPITLLSVLKEEGNIYHENLSAEDYKSLGNKARMGAQGLEVTLRENELARAAKEDRDLVNAFQTGNANAAYTSAELNRINGRRALAIQQLKDGKITPSMRDEVFKVQARRERLVKIIIDYHYLNSKPAFGVGDDEIPEELAVSLAEIDTKKPTPEDIADLRIKTAEAVRDGKMSMTAATTLNKNFALTEEALAKSAKENTGFIISWTGIQTGNAKINSVLSTLKLNPRDERRVRIHYLESVNQFKAENGTTPGRKEAVKLAQDAIDDIILRPPATKK